MNKTLLAALAALALALPAMAQQAQVPQFIGNLVYETDLNNSFDNLRGIYKIKPAQSIELDTVYVSTMMNANGGGVFRNHLFQFINYIDAGGYMPSQSAICASATSTLMAVWTGAAQACATAPLCPRRWPQRAACSLRTQPLASFMASTRPTMATAQCWHVPT